jgi:hypothetical protein
MRWLQRLAAGLFVLLAMGSPAQSGPVVIDNTGAPHPTIGTLPSFQPPPWVD